MYHKDKTHDIYLLSLKMTIWVTSGGGSKSRQGMVPTMTTTFLMKPQFVISRRCKKKFGNSISQFNIKFEFLSDLRFFENPILLAR